MADDRERLENEHTEAGSTLGVRSIHSGRNFATGSACVRKRSTRALTAPWTRHGTPFNWRGSSSTATSGTRGTREGRGSPARTRAL